MLVDIITRPADDPDQPPRVDRTNLARPGCNRFAIRHIRWALKHGRTVYITPVKEGDAL